MQTVFRYRLARLRGQILGWGIALALLSLFIAQFYGTMLEQQEQFEKLLESYPKEVLAFFGDSLDLATPSGYLGYYNFSMMPLIVGIFVVLVGSGLLASDEESGRLDLIVAHPVSRAALFWGRWLAFVSATLAILGLSWLGLYLPTAWTPLDVGWLEVTWPYLSLLGALMLFGMLALLLSMLLPSRRLAASVAGMGLAGSYFLASLARINADLEPAARLSPLYYYQGGEAMEGLNTAWFAGLLMVALLFALLAWRRFWRRDIRVGGEGGWTWPNLRSFKRAKEAIARR
jgi:ABC-2 type transport system permease protein